MVCSELILCDWRNFGKKETPPPRSLKYNCLYIIAQKVYYRLILQHGFLPFLPKLYFFFFWLGKGCQQIEWFRALESYRMPYCFPVSNYYKSSFTLKSCPVWQVRDEKSNICNEIHQLKSGLSTRKNILDLNIWLSSIWSCVSFANDGMYIFSWNWERGSVEVFWHVWQQHYNRVNENYCKSILCV